MCTTATTQLNKSWYLAKTRDPVEWMRWDDEIKLFDTDQDSCKKLIIQNPNPKEDGYYGGINEHGVAYTSTFVCTREDQVSYIRRPYIRLILEAKTAKEAVTIIKNFNPIIGGNMFVADADECYGIEGSWKEYFVEKIHRPTVKTNHFAHLDAPNISFKTTVGYAEWSATHKERAQELIDQADTVDDIKALLTDRKNVEKNQAICTTSSEEACFTHSAFIFDTYNKKVFYAQGNPLEVGFEEYGF